MEHIECIVIGAGVIGLAIARKFALCGHEVVVLEAEDNAGTQISSRNSGVIHAGLYYPCGSLKALTCLEGNKLLYKYCDEKNIAIKPCGKLVVATEAEQQKQLLALKQHAEACGVNGLRLLNKKEALEFEPDLKVDKALYSPATGIIDVAGFVSALQNDLEQHKGVVVYRSKVSKIDEKYTLNNIVLDNNIKVKCNFLVNASGHGSISLARSVYEKRVDGKENPITDAVNQIPDQYFAKGSYFKYSGSGENKALPFNHLIYPLPEVSGLGIHLSLDLDGQGRFGPDVEWVNSAKDLMVDQSREDIFYQQIRKYWPGLPDNSLQADYAGIRPKISGPGKASRDFIIQGPESHGFPGLVHLFGIESPGLTASLAIAELVYKKLDA